jgi:hypothetical protein
MSWPSCSRDEDAGIGPAIFFRCESRDEPQPIGNLFLGHFSQASGQFEGGQDVGPFSGEEFDIVRQVFGLIKMPADEEHGAFQLPQRSRHDRRDAAAPESGNGRRMLLRQGGG